MEELLDLILYENENTRLDFKRDEYKKEDYSSLLKDVLSMANAFSTQERLNHLDTTSDDFSNSLDEEIERITRVIPQQNKAELTHYVARRKFVLELFSLILNRKLTIQNDGSRNNDEALLHNLIFQQNTTTPEKSDLWIINEDFIYFQGLSEFQLSEIKFKGENIIREDLTEEEKQFINSIGEKRLNKRPDILLFPQEEKCIMNRI